MQQECIACGLLFHLTEEDTQLLKKLSPVIGNKTFDLPPPTHCPTCRQQRRFADCNERNIYWRTSDYSGERMLSLYAPDSAHTVYRKDEWWSDHWDPLTYGVDFNANIPFFKQFDVLLRTVPRRGMNQDGTNENCEYNTYGINNKNCYLTYGCAMCEDVYHSSWTYCTKDSVDCLMSGEGELLYECTDCKRCYHCFFCHDCTGCNEVYLSQDCRNCTHCIGCKNLRNKEYYIYNKPVSKQVYEAYLHTCLADGFKAEQETFHAWKLQFPYCYRHDQQSEHSEGDYLEGAKNCFDCYDIVQGAEDCRYCQLGGMQCKDVMDGSMIGINVQMLYESNNSLSCTQGAFLNFCKDCTNCYYCDTVRGASNCFGCVGLRQKEYCILNKQYSKEEYEALVPQIIDHMRSTSEWGEYVPITMSPFAYNETVAQDFFPLSKEEVLAKGFAWRDKNDDITDVTKVIPAEKLPTSIHDIPDDILNWAIVCAETGRPFRIIAQELKFYRKEGLAIPTLHPDERHKRRVSLRNPRILYDRHCAQCKTDIRTTFAPGRPEIVYCEECYLAAVHGTEGVVV